MLESMPETSSLAGGDFERDLTFAARQRGEHLVQSRNNPTQTGFLAISHVRSWMQHKKWETELIRPAQFLAKRANRFFPEFRVLRPGIDQVARVPEDQLRSICEIEVGCQFGFGKWFGKPLHVVLHEYLDHAASNRSTALQGLRGSSSDGHVRSEQWK